MEETHLTDFIQIQFFPYPILCPNFPSLPLKNPSFNWTSSVLNSTALSTSNSLSCSKSFLNPTSLYRFSFVLSQSHFYFPLNRWICEQRNGKLFENFSLTFFSFLMKFLCLNSTTRGGMRVIGQEIFLSKCRV